MKELQWGIHALDYKNTASSEPVVVIVHPFYRQLDFNRAPPAPHTFKTLQSILKHPMDPYLSAMEQLLVLHTGPIVTFEDYQYVEGLAMLYSHLGRNQNTYFIETIPDDSMPAQLDFEQIAEFLKRFNTRPIRLMGGYFHNFGPEDCGCLGYIGHKLQEQDFHVELVQGLFYT